MPKIMAYPGALIQIQEMDMNLQFSNKTTKMHIQQLLPLLPLAVASASASTPGGGGGGQFITPRSSPNPLHERATCSTVLSPSYQSPVVGSGWVAQIIANDLDSPRSIVFDSSGGMLVLEQEKGITRLTFSSEDDTSTCLVEESRETVVDDEELLHGLALSPGGETLYASTSDKVYAWNYDPEGGTVTGDPTTLVQGMDSGGHVTRTILLLSGESEGMMLVSRGSNGNLDYETREIDSGVSQIRAFNLTAMDVGSDDFSASAYTDGDVLGWGLRNSVGLAQDPVTGAIWSVENSADQMQRLGEDIHTDNPGEELNFHGYLNGSDSEGRNFGYPDCFAVWGTENFPGLGDMATGSQFANEGSEKSDEECQSDTQAPRLTFQAHVAPLDVMVMGEQGVAGGTSNSTDDGEKEMYITFHGSWNRDDPVGYALVSVKMDAATGQPVAESSSTDAATLVMSNPDNSECPDGCFRPVGLAMDDSRRLFMTSDKTGEIFVLRKADFSAGTIPGGGSDDDGDDGEIVGGDDDSAGIAGKDRGGFALAVWCSSLAAVMLAGLMGL
ncbi:uncharacterized protein MKZ38_005622 [Zalerion maritima]|uniref:Pyrroloquinoline quinone-dependent pyranose dehydrogenase beta-propeller domain-containing protein n=1 Tax=Zalerion maritima TaxID=339359 RepID=A0AAD5RL32_9PEZI|nr:uncharacterized protein MKZ38_005622 [Zalerion maritima]